MNFKDIGDISLMKMNILDTESIDEPEILADGIVEFDEETAKIRSLKILIKNSKNWWLYKCYFCKKKTPLYQLSNFFNLCLEMD